MRSILCSGCGKSIGNEGYRYKHENFCRKCFRDTVCVAIQRSCRDDYHDQV